MYCLETLAALNADVKSSYYEEHPLKQLLEPKDVRYAPDYSGCLIDEVEKIFKVKKIKEYFVDSSGFGSPGEPALTFREFLECIKKLLSTYPKKRLYSALTGIGQFQVYVTIFEKIPAGKR